MKKLIFLLTILNIVLLAQTKTIPQGWSLNGVGLNESAINPSSLPTGIKTIWKYNGGWQAYSPDSSTQSQLSKAGISTLESLESGDGFWINADSETSFSSYTTSKIVSGSFESTADETYDDFTYNYTTEAGLILNDKIDWTKATSLDDAGEYNEKVLNKAIAKVFFSVDKKTALIVNEQDCSQDLTIAVTPYSSISTIPAIMDFIRDDSSSNLTSSSSSKTSGDSKLTLDLTSYLSTNSVVEPVLAFSSDVSVEDSSGNRLPPSALDSICTNVDIDILFKNISEYDSGATYKLHYINGYDDINSSNITLTDNTNNVKLVGVLPNFKPFFISKKSSETLAIQSDLELTLDSSVLNTTSNIKLFSSKINAKYTTSNLTVSSSSDSSSILANYPNISNLTTRVEALGYNTYEAKYGFSITSGDASIRHYIKPITTLKEYLFFGYNSTIKNWSLINSHDISGDFSHFIILSASFEESDCTIFKDKEYCKVTSPTTGKVWLDRNLGADQVCESLGDEVCYGDYYQWGRDTDGHEKSDSTITETLASTTNPNHNEFIYNATDNEDWTTTDIDGSQRALNWNPCPSGFRIPTIDELTEENIFDSSTSNIVLKIPQAGDRDSNGPSYIGNNGSNGSGFLWSSSVGISNEYHTQFIRFSSSPALWTGNRADGMSVRCIKAD